jgi:hypothetical protein
MKEITLELFFVILRLFDRKKINLQSVKYKTHDWKPNTYNSLGRAKQGQSCEKQRGLLYKSVTR